MPNTVENLPATTDDAAAPHKHKKRKAAAKAATKALDTTTSTARDLTERAVAGIEANPLAVLVGSVALGVLAGAFVPRTDRETALLGPVGKRLTDSAKDAIDTARDTVKSEFDVLGLSRHAARDQAGKLLEGVVGAVASAATAAISTRGKASDAKTAE